MRRTGPVGPVVVAVDGSVNATEAIRAAAAAAVLRCTGLDIVHVAAPALFGRNPHRLLLADAVATARSHAPDLEPRAIQRTGPVARVLAELTQDSDLLVLGSRGHGVATDVVIGSVALEVIARAWAPVLVVRPGSARPREGGAVIAAIGTDADRAVLRCAFEEADLRGAPLRIVHGDASRWGPVAGPLQAAGMVREEGLPAERIDHWRAQYPDVAVTAQDTAQPPARAVLDAAGEAALIVTGSHGRKPRAGWLLGSISQAILHQAPCPVMVVPPSWR